jgi:hypothetical protein
LAGAAFLAGALAAAGFFAALVAVAISDSPVSNSVKVLGFANCRPAAMGNNLRECKHDA